MQAKPGPWEFHSRVLTSQTPQEICNNIIRGKILEYLPLEVPYGVAQVRAGLPVGCSVGNTQYFVMRIPLFEWGDLPDSAWPRGVTWGSHVGCVWGVSLSGSEGKRPVRFLRCFADLLSTRSLSQVTEVWEEGEGGELLIVQNLLVPRKSHMVSNRTEGGSARRGCLGPAKRTLAVPCCPSAVGSLLGRAGCPTQSHCAGTADPSLELPRLGLGTALLRPLGLLCGCTGVFWDGSLPQLSVITMSTMIFSLGFVQKMLIGRGGEVISRIAQEAGQDLMNVFLCDVRLKLKVDVKS